ncbi:GW dipeptide domain-containing protein [Oenococcus oeni]
MGCHTAFISCCLEFLFGWPNQQTASAATSSQTKAVSYDKITNKQTVNYSAYVNENNRNDGLYSAPALTDVASMTSTGSAKSLNGHLVTVSEIDTTKRASTGVSYQYAKITDNNKSYWVDLRALNDSAQITSTQTVNFQAYINGDTRNDGLYSAPALTTSSSLTPLAYSKSLNKKSVMVSEIDTTKRASTGLSYQYAKITYNGKTYWVDARAVFDSITSKQTNLNYYATISETNRNDGIYEEPALTSLASMASTGSVKTFDQDSVEVLEIDTTFRNSNDQKYQYAKVTNGTNTYWVDVRALNASSFAKITSSKAEDYSAYINEASRNDSIYNNGPALTSPTTLTASALAKTVNGDQVEVIALDTTTRSNGSQYTYLEVKDGSNTYWIDSRAVTAYNFDTVTNQQTVNETATINEGSRSDGLYSAPALTSPTSLTSTGSAKTLNGDKVTVTEIDTTKRASNGNTYQYAKIAYNGKTYWVDVRALNSVTYQGTITVEYEDENGNQIAAPTMITKNVYSEYTTSPEMISGYTVNLSKTQGITDGMTFATQTVVYVYDKNAATTTDLISGQGQGTDSNRWVVGTDVQPGWYKITPINLGTNDWIGLDATTSGIINDNDFYAEG